MRSRSMTPFLPGQGPARPEPPNLPAPPPDGNGEPRNLLNFINNMQKDDYILIGIIAVLFFEGCDDYILLAALGYLFLMGIL